MEPRRDSADSATHPTSAVLCSFQHYASNRLATADAHGRVMIHSLTDGGEGIVVDALLDLSLGSLQGVLLLPIAGCEVYSLTIFCTAGL